MKKFGEGQQPFKAIMDIPEGDSQELTTVTDQALNSLYGELFNLLQLHGINPTTTTSADLKQVARAVWSAIAAGCFFYDTGTDNLKNLTHAKGGNFLFKNSNANDDGFIVEFLNKFANTGAVSINVFDAENNINHFNAVSMVDVNGNNLTANFLQKNSFVKAIYNKSLNKFICLGVFNSFIDDANVFNAEGLPLRSVSLQTVDSIEALKTLNTTEKRVVFAKSYYAGAGRGGGFFVLNETQLTDNNAIVVQSANPLKKWIRFDNSKITPDMFGCLPNDPNFDNTQQLNKALATGLDVHGLSSDIYYVGGIIEAQGQQLKGGWKISTSRYNLGLVSTEVEEIDHNRLRFCYVGTAYDLSELLHIKQLGFNTINFYGGFQAGTQNENGTMLKMLNNAKTAKLRVNLNTEHGEAGVDLAKFVADYDNHPSVYCYTVFDEPATRNITVAQQDEKIALLRTMTKKPLTMVDLVLNQSPFLQVFSQNYDQVYVDSYSNRRNSGDINNDIYKDLEKMRIDYCLVKAMTKCDKVIPVCGLFQFKGANYTDNVEQILAAAKIFSTVDGGNWGAFVWDGEGDTNITSNLRDNLDFKKFAKEANKQRDIKKPISDVYLFGGRDSEKDWGVQQLFKLVNIKDAYTTDDNINNFAYPITLTKSNSETDRTTATALPSDVQSISGIGFQGDWAGICLDIPLRKKLRICLRLENFAKSSGDTYFSLHHSSDGGYSQQALWQDTQTSTIKVHETLIDTSAIAGRMLGFVVREPTATVRKYRKLIMGYIIATDW